ncbi:MAG TPA: hypothetical protein VID72_07020 [Ktedonobacterales bacterium]
MSDLARGARRPAIGRPGLDHARADAGADEDADEIVNAARGSIVLLANGRHVHVIAERDRLVEALAQQLRQRQIVEAEAEIRAG